MVGFLRSFCKVSFLAKFKKEDDSMPQRRIFLTRPTNLHYEKYVFSHYLQIVRFVQD